MVRVVELGCDPDVLSLGAIGVAEHLLEGPANLFVVAISISTVNMAVANPQSMLDSLLNLICKFGAVKIEVQGERTRQMGVRAKGRRRRTSSIFCDRFPGERKHIMLTWLALPGSQAQERQFGPSWQACIVLIDRLVPAGARLH